MDSMSESEEDWHSLNEISPSQKWRIDQSTKNEKHKISNKRKDGQTQDDNRVFKKRKKEKIHYQVDCNSEDEYEFFNVNREQFLVIS